MKISRRVLLIVTGILVTPAFLAAQNSDTVRCSIKAEPNRVTAGNHVTLTWSSFGATSAHLDGIGSVPTSGSRRMPVQTSQKFALTVRKGADHHICFTEVAVTSQSPTCFISAWPQNIQQGGSATVTWSSSSANSFFVTNLGSVPQSGSSIVYPSKTTAYTFTARGVGPVCTQTTHVNVSPRSSSYGYFPTVIGNILNPLTGRNSNNSGNAYDGYSYEEVTYYEDDKWDEYEKYYYDPYYESDDEDGCEWWDYWCGYDSEVEAELYGENDPCLWDWWCSNAEQGLGIDDEDDDPPGTFTDNYQYQQPDSYPVTQGGTGWCDEYGPDSGMCGGMPWQQFSSDPSTPVQENYGYWETSTEYSQPGYNQDAQIYYTDYQGPIWEGTSEMDI